MKTYTLTSSAYGQPAGSSLALDDTDPLVQMNVENGVLVEGKGQTTKAQTMSCPICAENQKTPVNLKDEDDLASHYEDKHAGFAVPAYHPDEEAEK